jgi:hypothetical protein
MGCTLNYALIKCIDRGITDNKIISRYLKLYYNIILSEEALCSRIKHQQKNK